MGAKRGQRNRDQDRYWHERRKAEQGGMVGAALAVTCQKCGDVSPEAETFKGWCLPCVEAWTDTVDPWVLKQAQGRLPESVIAHTLVRDVEQLEVRLIQDRPADEEFLPLTQFMGSRGLGQQRSMWNYLQALYVFEVGTTRDALQFGIHAPNTVHLCGRHAPVQRISIQGFLSRIHSAGDAFKPWGRDRRFVDFMRGFIADNRIRLFKYQPHGVDVFDRARLQRVYAKIGKPHFDRCCPAHWPFEGEHAGRQREKGELEELPDVVMQVGELVPNSLPWSVREDLCQDLVVAVLGGETTIEELRAEHVMGQFIANAFRLHPLRYGRYSLDAGVRVHSYSGDDGGLGTQADKLTIEDRAQPAPAHFMATIEPMREFGAVSMGEALRHKHGGYAIDGPMVVRDDELEMDEDIREVFEAETSPRWRRKYSA